MNASDDRETAWFAVHDAVARQPGWRVTWAWALERLREGVCKRHAEEMAGPATEGADVRRKRQAGPLQSEPSARPGAP